MPSPCAHCPRPAVAHGLCGTHYQRRRRGRPLERPVQQRCGAEIHIDLPESLAARTRSRARELGLTVSECVRAALAAWLA